MEKMKTYKRAHDSVHWFMNELSSRIIAESKIPSDRYHLGKLILQSLKDAPDFIMQIDGATNESETNVSVMERSVRCAICFTKLNLQINDVICIMAPNHINIAIPYYAALYLGVTIAAIDINLGVEELEDSFTSYMPKIIFCQSEKVATIQKALDNVEMNAKIITFDKVTDVCSFDELLESHGDNSPVENFKPSNFDPEDTVACITSTSGTIGLPKGAALTHKNLSILIPYNWLGFTDFPTPTRMALVLSPLQWLSAGFQFLFSPILRYTRLQSSRPISKEDTFHLINTYRPTIAIITPTFVTTLLKFKDSNPCDFSCFEQIFLSGSAVYPEVYDEVQEAMPNARVNIGYGMSEVSGFTFYDEFPTRDRLGKPIGCFNYRLVDIETQKDIYEPNVPGELWLKGPTVFKGYYNNPEATAEVFQDGWIKTGDIIYRDEHWNFYFVDRLKLLLKYKNNHISPVEIEAVIRRHPGVLDAAVTGVPRRECGDVPVACVVPRAHCTPTAHEIKDLVKDSLADSKQLRGGVIFMTELPTTATTKVHRRKLKEIVLDMLKE